MPSFLNSGLVDPSGTASVKSIGIAMGLPFPLSMKDMLQHRVMSKVIRYGIYLCTYTGATRGTILDDGWLDRVFSDPLGVASYFRKMSCGRQLVEWQVFPYKGDIMTLAEKQVLEKKVNTIGGKVDFEIEPTYQTALAKGIPVDSVDHVIFVIDLKDARAGVRGSNHIFLAANDIRPNNICHEMGHIFGLAHASQAEKGDYGDSYCLMGGLGPAGGNATEFQNSRLIVSTGKDSHGGTGPGICTPYLSKLGWIDSSINANHIYLSEDGTLSGDVTGTIYANQGGLPIASTKRIALIIDVPSPSSPSAYANSQYWVEYRTQQGYDRRILPALLLREVVTSHSYYLYLRAAEYNIDNRNINKKLRLPKLNYVIKITDIDSSSQQITYRFEKAE